jgi:hypothetical protein
MPRSSAARVLGPGKVLLIDDGPYGESWSEASDYSHAFRILLRVRVDIPSRLQGNPASSGEACRKETVPFVPVQAAIARLFERPCGLHFGIAIQVR